MSTKTLKQLNAVISAERKKVRAAGWGADRYNASAEAAKNIAMAAFDYAARREGLTGFQASWAAGQFFAEVLGITSPFAIVDAGQMLNPHYPSPSERGRELENEWVQWCGEAARRKMAAYPQSEVSPNVWAHWEALSARSPAGEE